MRLAAWAGIACAGLSAALWSELRVVVPAAEAPGAATAVASAPAEPATRHAADPATLLARPIFAASRRPPGNSARPDAPAAPPPPPPRLTGTLVAGPSRPSAILLASGGAPGARHVLVHEGDRVGAFTVVRIAPGTVDAVGPAGPLTLRLGRADGRAPAVMEPDAFGNLRSRGATEQDE